MQPATGQHRWYIVERVFAVDQQPCRSPRRPAVRRCSCCTVQATGRFAGRPAFWASLKALFNGVSLRQNRQLMAPMLPVDVEDIALARRDRAGEGGAEDNLPGSSWLSYGASFGSQAAAVGRMIGVRPRRRRSLQITPVAIQQGGRLQPQVEPSSSGLIGRPPRITRQVGGGCRREVSRTLLRDAGFRVDVYAVATRVR